MIPPGEAEIGRNFENLVKFWGSRGGSEIGGFRKLVGSILNLPTPELLSIFDSLSQICNEPRST
jgi:hypothetical protein